MWENLAIIVIVGVALFFTARMLMRLLTSKDGGCAGCTGCCRVSECPSATGCREAKTTKRKNK